jgi:acetyl esterase/lipase
MIAVGGDSARESPRWWRCAPATRALAFQLLVYPLVDFTDYAAFDARVDEDFLTRPVMDYFADHYLPRGVDRRQAWVSPLPPTSPDCRPPSS